MSGPVTTALPTPQRNHFLAALSDEVRTRLFPDLSPVSLPFGSVLKEPGSSLRHVYFPVDAIVSLVCVLENGAATEVAQVGYEGLIGVTSCMDGLSTPNRAVVTSAGFAYRLPEKRFKEEIDRYGEALRLLLRYTQSLMTQMAQAAVCNRHHSIDRQLCRWFLSALDRLPGRNLKLSHETIAHLLGVRREGVSEAAGKLQKLGAIEYRHGHVTVLDRGKLEQLSCECYAVVRKETDRLLPEAAGGREQWRIEDAVVLARPVLRDAITTPSSRSYPARHSAADYHQQAG
jgi:CRP-like cAMP-binding protein